MGHRHKRSRQQNAQNSLCNKMFLRRLSACAARARLFRYSLLRLHPAVESLDPTCFRFDCPRPLRIPLIDEALGPFFVATPRGLCALVQRSPSCCCRATFGASLAHTGLRRPTPAPELGRGRPQLGRTRPNICPSRLRSRRRRSDSVDTATISADTSQSRPTPRSGRTRAKCGRHNPTLVGSNTTLLGRSSEFERRQPDVSRSHSDFGRARRDPTIRVAPTSSRKFPARARRAESERWNVEA